MLLASCGSWSRTGSCRQWQLTDLGLNEERRRIQASSVLDRLAHSPSLSVGRSCDTKGPQCGVHIARLRPRFSIRLTASTGATAAPTRPAPWRSSGLRPEATYTAQPSALRQPNQLTGSASRDRAPIYDLRGRARSARLPTSPARRGIAQHLCSGMAGWSGRSHPSRARRCQRGECEPPRHTRSGRRHRKQLWVYRRTTVRRGRWRRQRVERALPPAIGFAADAVTIAIQVRAISGIAASHRCSASRARLGAVAECPTFAGEEGSPGTGWR